MTSRICIKNVPKHAKESRLKQHFSLKGGEVTDIKLLHTVSKNGEKKSRQICFLGYKTNKQAEDAIAHFNGTYLDTSKLIVEKALAPGDEKLARPWSKYSVGSSLHQIRNPQLYPSEEKNDSVNLKNVNAASEEKKKKVDEAYEEFMQVMKPKSQKSTWENDDGKVVKEKVKAKRPGGENVLLEKMHLTFKADEDDDNDADGNDEKLHFDDDDDDADGNEDDEDNNDIVIDKKDVNIDNKKEAKAKEKEKVKVKKEEEEEEENIEFDESRLFIRNLPYSATVEELTKFIEKCCPGVTLKEVHISVDKETKKSKGIGFVLFSYASEAESGLQVLDKKIFQGRLLHVLPSKLITTAIPSSTSKNNNKIEGATSAYKDEREKKKKEDRSNEASWNPLFMLDSAADAVALKLAVRKSDILDVEADNMAVRMALGETKIIEETRRVLEKEGVKISAFDGLNNKNSKIKRSDSILLVKNIPHDTAGNELTELFESYGAINRIVIPPARTLAIIEFVQSSSAKKAFEKLSYSRFKNRPLYLEWAPIDSFISNTDSTNNNANNNSQNKSSTIQVADRNNLNSLSADDIGEPMSTLMVKNLNFDTRDAELKRHFSRFDAFIRKVTIPKKTDTTDSSKFLSSGYGFVEFANVSKASEALKSLQSSVLDGHQLQLVYSRGNNDNNSNNNVNNNNITKSTLSKNNNNTSNTKLPADATTKLIIRNIPFEASRKDVMELFGSFGTLKQVRMPKKFDGGHRGFCFVEFMTKQEAVNAKESLSFTHLYGRHLVSEFAKDDTTIEHLREKAQKDLKYSQTADELARKRQKMQMDEDDDEDGLSDDENDDDDD